MATLQYDPEEFARDGFALFDQALDPQLCEDIGRAVIGEYDHLTGCGWRFAAGGRVTGHLNFTAGQYSRQILELLQENGLLRIAEEVLGAPLKLVSMVGNMNLPGSRPQDIHQDWAPPGEALVINIALVATAMDNGATEIIPGTQGSRFSYTSLHRSGAADRARFWTAGPGDAIMRLATTWHRGRPNRSSVPRPMLSVILERRGPADDPATALVCTDAPRIRFTANRFHGRAALARELAAVYLARPLHLLRLARGR